MKYMFLRKLCAVSLAMMVASLSLGLAAAVGMAELILVLTELLK